MTCAEQMGPQQRFGEELRNNTIRRRCLKVEDDYIDNVDKSMPCGLRHPVGHARTTSVRNTNPTHSFAQEQEHAAGLCDAPRQFRDQCLSETSFLTELNLQRLQCGLEHVGLIGV